MNRIDPPDALAAAMAKAIAPHLLERIASGLVQAVTAELRRSAAEADRLLTPNQVRALKRTSSARVYAAIKDGSLKAEERTADAAQSKGVAGARRWFVRQADAARWQP